MTKVTYGDNVNRPASRSEIVKDPRTTCEACGMAGVALMVDPKTKLCFNRDCCNRRVARTEEKSR